MITSNFYLFLMIFLLPGPFCRSWCRSKLQAALKVTDRYELRLVEAGSGQAVALEAPLKNAPTFKARTVPALNLQCTLNPNSTQQPNQANQKKFKNTKSENKNCKLSLNDFFDKCCLL